MGELPRSKRENGLLYVHGSARNPLNEYVFPEDIYNQRKMERIFALVDKYCFQGHTHIPGIFLESLSFLSPEEIDLRYELSGEKAVLNVGSVGQPRDGDPRGLSSCDRVQKIARSAPELNPSGSNNAPWS